MSLITTLLVLFPYLSQKVPATSPTVFLAKSFPDASVMLSDARAARLFRKPKSDAVVSLDAPVSPMKTLGSSNNSL